MRYQCPGFGPHPVLAVAVQGPSCRPGPPWPEITATIFSAASASQGLAGRLRSYTAQGCSIVAEIERPQLQPWGKAPCRTAPGGAVLLRHRAQVSKQVED